jgi:pyruvate/2-oxoglutarate dehydrogenase complex dihydrolipoamide acyltransferase (E2) component
MTRSRQALALFSLLGMLVATEACRTTPTPAASARPTPTSDWGSTLARALEEAQAARFAAADRTLAEYAERFPGTTAANEAGYWRALLKLDPTNSAASARDALALLDAYLALSPAPAHRTEAATLRRVAAAMDARATAAVTTTPPVPHVDERAHTEEILRLREELSRANAELARIKRRLTRP